MEEYITHLRHFIALGNADELAFAIKKCVDNTLRSHLEGVDHHSLTNAECKRVQEYLCTSDRPMEAAVFAIFCGIRDAVVAQDPKQLPDRTSWDAAVKTTTTLLSLCTQHGFSECEAVMCGMLALGMSKMRLYGPAQSYYRRALQLYRPLANTDYSYYTFVRSILLCLGTMCTETGQYHEASEAFGEALAMFKALPDAVRQRCRKDIGTAQNGLGVALSEMHRFPEAKASLEAALSAYDLLLKEGDASVRSDMAGIRINLGSLLFQMRAFGEALQQFLKAFEDFRDLSDANPSNMAFLPSLAMARASIGYTLAALDQPTEGRKELEIALVAYRHLAKKEPTTYKPMLALTLLDLGSAIMSTGNGREAEKVLVEALDEYHSLADHGHHEYEQERAMATEMLAIANGARRDFSTARELFDRSVRIAESPHGNTQDHRLARGRCSESYIEMAFDSINHNDLGQAYRYLAALREGQYLATHSDGSDTLDDAVHSLRRLRGRIDRDVHILIVDASPADTLFLVLSSTGLSFCPSDRPMPTGLARCYIEWLALVDKISDLRRILSHSLSTEERVSLEKDIASLNAEWTLIAQKVPGEATAAYEWLPTRVRDLLHPDSSSPETTDILLSAHGSLREFPFEAMRYGPASDNYVGVARLLPRIAGISPNAIDDLAPECQAHPFGRRAMVVADSKGDLIGAREESYQVATLLRKAGYSLLPNGKPLLGSDATVDNVLETLVCGDIDLFHYAGHGIVDGNEEALVLSNGLLGTWTLRDKNVRLNRRPLLVMNACWGGRLREYGGDREDLLSEFLSRGAGAVVACAFPVASAMGDALGSVLYHHGVGVSHAYAGDLFLEARRAVEQAARIGHPEIWPNWALLTYHGDPYLRLS